MTYKLRPPPLRGLLILVAFVLAALAARSYSICYADTPSADTVVKDKGAVTATSPTSVTKPLEAAATQPDPAAPEAAPATTVTTTTTTAVSPAPGAPAPKLTPNDPVPYLKGLIASFSGKHWMIFAALFLSGVVWLARKYLPATHFFKTDAGGFILALLLGVITGLTDALVGGAKISPDLLLQGVETGVLAAGGWSGVKKILRMNTPADQSTNLPLKP